jgi:hypothetical protein
MLPSTFNVEAFTQAQFEGANDTRFLRIEPKEYMAQIVGPFGEDRKTRIRTSDSGFIMLDVVWQPTDPAQQEKLNLEKLPTVRQTVFLDVTPQGGLDMSPFKNGDLGRLREALGLNIDGQRWSFHDFVGRVARINVVHRPNENDPANPYTDVKGVTKAS